MELNKVKRIHDFGQSIWLDFIDRNLMASGQLKKLIEEDGIRGITSNPAIFEKAINNSDDYSDQIKKLGSSGVSNEEIFYTLAIDDIQAATDFFKPVYDQKKVGSDGYVSLEVSPLFARDTGQTIRQARELWNKVGRQNVMIKIPGTDEGLAPITEATSEGININVTLLFGLEQYKKVTEAYIRGLEIRQSKGLPLDRIASVASFFLSRIDVLIDPLLASSGLSAYRGTVAIASAKLAYQIYKEVFSSERFAKLEAFGAMPQRVLWASTSSKDPQFSDIKYVEALIGPHTVDTIPLETLVAYRDHGDAQNRLEEDIEGAKNTLKAVAGAGIDLFKLTQQLEHEGIDKFIKPYEKLLGAIEAQRHKV